MVSDDTPREGLEVWRLTEDHQSEVSLTVSLLELKMLFMMLETGPELKLTLAVLCLQRGPSTG